MRALASANLALRFACELGALAALAVSGAEIGDDPAVHVLLGLTLPVLMVAAWAMWVAPRARNRLADPARAGVEVIIFGAAVAALVAAGHVVPAVVLGVAAAVSGALVRVWPEPAA